MKTGGLGSWLGTEIPAAPLAVFRIIFGSMMFLATIRFMLNGWVDQQYVLPGFHFSYFGFDWLPRLPETGVYLVFILMAVSALFVAVGLFYHWSAFSFFILFTYIEFLDKSNYLNHYYFVSIVSALMVFLPAGRWFSLDVSLRNVKPLPAIPGITIVILQLQLGIVYFFAGLAKLNSDWLLEAMPLKIWLPAHNDLPLIGPLLSFPETAYFFSWFGCIYDLTIPFFLIWNRSRPFAYMAVIVFHAATAMLFQIGMFPWIMILSTLVFFPPSFHEKLIRPFYRGNFSINPKERFRFPTWITGVLAVHFLIQIILPLRSHVYPGELFWTEQGYRFSWRVMLMEKAGSATFYVKDAASGKKVEVSNREFLTPNQEKMMATQPDMILQYASFLKDQYERKGFMNAEVQADVFVTLNGSGSRRFIDPSVNLAAETDGFHHKSWILPFGEAPWLAEEKR